MAWMRVRVAVPSVVATCAVTLGLLAVPPAAAAPSSESPAVPEASAQTQPPRVVNGTLEAPPELSVAAESVMPGRVGGTGSFEVVFASTARNVKVVRDLEVRIAAPKDTTIGDVMGERWRCAVGRSGVTATCELRGEVGRDEDPPSIAATLKIGSRFTSETARISAWARWSGSSRGTSNWTVHDEGTVSVYPAATLQLSSNADTITAFRNGPRESRQVLLSAAIGKLQDQYAVLSWRQVSGPPVRFLMPKIIDGVSSEAQQIAEFTQLPDRQRYVFAARVVAQGQVVERRIGIVVRGENLLEELDAATPSESTMAASTTLPRLRGALTVEAQRDFRIDGPLFAAAGGRATVRALGDDARRGTVTWSVDEAVFAKGASASVRVPAVPGRAVLVSARVTLPSGIVASAEHVIIAGAVGAKPRAGTTSRDATAFCRVVTAIRKGQEASGASTFEMPMGSQGVQRLSFRLDRGVIDTDALDGQARCTGAGGVDITGGVLVQSPRVRLANVSARLTADGLEVLGARATVNSSLSNALTDQLGLDIAGDLRATWTRSTLGLLGGTATFTAAGEPPVNPVETVLKLPDGWEYPVDGSQITFAEDLDVRLTQAVRSPVNAQGTRATLVVGLDIAGEQPTSVDVTVANLVLGETPRGGLISTSGSGQMDIAESEDDTSFRGELRLAIECDSGWDSRNCELLGGLRLGRADLLWSREGIVLDATAAVSIGESRAYGVDFAGSYRAENDWDLSVTDSAPWELGDELFLRELRGSVQSRPAADAARLTMSLTGTLSGLSLGDRVTIKRLTPTLTNACPVDGSEPSCTVDEMKFFLDAELEALLPGSETPTVFPARADVNLTTLDFTFTTGAADMEVGPEELRLTDVRLVISRGAPTPCVPNGEDAVEDDTGISLNFAGSARILTRKYTLNVQSDARGLCIWGSGDTIDIGGGFRAVSPTVAFTTFPGGAKVNGDDTIEANRLVMRGGFVFPDNVGERFQIPGRGVTFEADISTDLKQAHFMVSYNADNELTLYQGEGASLTLGQLGFAVDVRWDGTSSGFDGYFLGTGRLDIDGSDEIPGSQMPLEVRIGVGYRVGESLRLEMTAGVPTDRVTNAFGVEGLTLRRLSAGASIDLILGTPSIAINADVTLPAGWGEAVGLLPGSAIALGANLAATSPCLEFRVGTAGGEPVVDLGGKGFITGNYFRLLLAPSGCELPDGRRTQRIAAGWAFSVQGSMLGSPFEATSLMQIDSTGMRIDAVLQLPRLDLYGVVGFRSFEGDRGPRVSLQMDTARDVFDVSLDAAIEIGDVASGFGVIAGVKGDITRAKDRFRLDLTGTSSTALGPIRLVLDPITIKGSIPLAGEESATNQLFIDISTGFAVTLDLGAFGAYTVRGSGRLQMQDFVVTQLSLRAGADFDAVVYRVKGDVAVDLCMGTLSEIKADGTGSQCTFFPRASLATSSPALRVGVTGTEFVPFKDPKPFAKTFYDREGVQK